MRRFDEESLQLEAVEAVRNTTRNALSGKALGEDRRLLFVLGVAGAGKTHLVVRELTRFAPPAYSALIFSPEHLADFGPWFDRQLIVSLVRTKTSLGRTTLGDIRSALLAAVSPKLRERIGKFTGRLLTSKTAIAVQKSVSQAAGRDRYGRMLKDLYQVNSRQRELSDLADDLSAELGFVEYAGSREFSAALILLDGPMSVDAMNWLIDGKIPAQLENWDAEPNQRPTNRSAVGMLSTALRRINGGLIIVFDQLEALAKGEAVGGALARLMRASIDMLRQYPNVAVIISALPDIASASVNALDDPERQRIQASNPISLPLLLPSEIPKFLEPRLAYLASCTQVTASIDLLRLFVVWLSGQRIALPPPRLVLRSVEVFARRVIYSTSADPMSDEFMRLCWNQAEASFGKSAAEPVSREHEQGDKIDLEWQHFQARTLQAGLVPTTTELAEGIQWGLEAIGNLCHGVASVSDIATNGWAGSQSVTYRVGYGNGVSSIRKLFIVDANKFTPRLKQQLNAVSPALGKASGIVVRPYGPLPAGPTTPIRSLVSQLRTKGCKFVDIDEGTAMNLNMLKQFHTSVPAPIWPTWMASRLSLVPWLDPAVAP